MKPNPVILVSIEGNIGAGKSTLVKKIQECSTSSDIDMICLQEPVDEWNEIKDENGVTILENFYQDQTKYAFSFQMMAYITRLKRLMDTIDEHTQTQSKTNNRNRKTIIVMERSLWTDKNIFAKMLYDDGKIGKMEYEIYNRWFNVFIEKIPPINVVYLKVPPSTCKERIQVRNRKGEENITIDYLKSCHEYHEKWLNKSVSKQKSNISLTIDDNSKTTVDEIKDWIKSL